MNCWICGSPNVSGEHIPKASTLKALFGTVSTSAPLFLSGEKRRNRPLQSINSTFLKYKQICANCNNSLTQKHDQAWDQFFSYLQVNADLLSIGSKISRAKLFGHNAKKMEVFLQLYLLKIFGTLCANHNVAIDFIGIGNSVKNSVAYPNFYFGISKRLWLNHLKAVLGSPIHIERSSITGKVEIAIQMMVIDKWQFEFIYVDPSYQIRKFPKCWNPLISSGFIVKNFEKR
jgi:hypothetical protein